MLSTSVGTQLGNTSKHNKNRVVGNYMYFYDIRQLYKFYFSY